MSDDHTINVGLVGVGNCASSLVQGVSYYTSHPTETAGLARPAIGPYRPEHLRFACAFDVDAAKVGQDLGKAIFAGQNNTPAFYDPGPIGVEVLPGVRLDGVGERYAERILVDDQTRGGRGEAYRIADALEDAEVDVLVNYLPVGSQHATELYASAALAADCGFVNAIPVFIARNPGWAHRFTNANLPLIGDDVKSQLGATIIHRALAQLFADRGVHLDRTYQLNVGGNMDFYNMLEQSRLVSKRQSKAEAVTSILPYQLQPGQVHIGPSDFVPWLEDHKLAFIRCEGRAFGGVPLSIELRMDVIDSPNSAGVVIDAVRCVRLALDHSVGGPLAGPCAWLMKAPPQPMRDDQALQAMEDFIGA